MIIHWPTFQPQCCKRFIKAHNMQYNRIIYSEEGHGVSVRTKQLVNITCEMVGIEETIITMANCEFHFEMEP